MEVSVIDNRNTSTDYIMRWLRELNVYGVCILHDGPPNIGEFEKVRCVMSCAT